MSRAVKFLASMEPKKFSCVKYSLAADAVAFPSMLQWSHNNSVVETLHGSRDCLSILLASMEPQQFSCGNGTV